MEIDWDGGVIADSEKIPLAQEPIYSADSDECFARVESAFVVTPEVKKSLYGEELKTRECPIGEGYDIPAAPSEQEYLDGYTTRLWMAWSFMDLRNLDEGAYHALNSACPQPQWSAGANG